MKHLFTGVFALLFATLSFSQGEVTIVEGNESFSTGSHNALIVTIPYGQKDIVEKELKNTFKDWKGKVSGKDELSMIQGEIKSMGKKAFDAWGKVKVEGDGTVKAYVAIDLGGAYLNSKDHGEQYNAIRTELQKFAVKAGQECVDLEIKAATKILEDYEKEQKDLEKEKEKLQDEIEDYKKKIADAEKSIEENDTKQEAKKEEIKTQTKTVGEIETKKKAIK